MSAKGLEAFSRQLVGVMPILFREFAKREDNELTRGKISFPQMVALDYAVHNPKIKMTDLAHILSIQMSSASVLVDRLIRQRMMSRRHDDKDRRVVWIRVTPKGKKIVSQILEQKRRSLKQIFMVLNERERSDYLKAILKVKNHLLSKRPNPK